jgi:alpha-glucosidase
MLRPYRRLLALRRTEPAVAIGDFRTRCVDAAVFAYERRRGERHSGVALNLSESPQPWDLGTARCWPRPTGTSLHAG